MIGFGEVLRVALATVLVLVGVVAKLLAWPLQWVASTLGDAANSVLESVRRRMEAA